MNQSTALADFQKMAAAGRPLTLADLPMVEELLARYPYYTLPAAMMLKAQGLDDDTAARLRSRLALNAPDLDSLMKLTDVDADKFATFYPPEAEPPTPSTDNAIDTFLSEYGSIDPHEQQLLERLIFNPVPDYSQVLAAQADDTPVGQLSEQDQLLDAFLARQSEAAIEAEHSEALAAATPPPPPAPADADAPLSESLAKIYVKQHRYDKAYEIIYQLSLNFPKKSVYFADQLRFLKKLMFISQANRKK